MEIINQEPSQPPPVDRGYVISIIIEIFKGHEDVEVHLYRPDWEESEGQDFNWENLLGEPLRRDRPIDPLGSRKVLLESFSFQEKEQVVEYVKQRYASRLKSLRSSVMPFPIPLGLVPLSEIQETETIGHIHFEKMPNYSLDFTVHGIYDLSKHKNLSTDNGG